MVSESFLDFVNCQSNLRLFTGLVYIQTRGKKSRGGGSTKNVSGAPPGPKLGLKVYDGQRVPAGTELLRQLSPQHMPGWNVDFVGGTHASLFAKCHGRVMMTTELMDPNLENEKVTAALPATVKPGQKFFKHYIHIIPDRQHQIFNLVDQI